MANARAFDETKAVQMAIEWITEISGDKETRDIHFDYQGAIDLYVAGFYAGLGSEIMKEISERIEET